MERNERDGVMKLIKLSLIALFILIDFSNIDASSKAGIKLEKDIPTVRNVFNKMFSAVEKPIADTADETKTVDASDDLDLDEESTQQTILSELKISWQEANPSALLPTDNDLYDAFFNAQSDDRFTTGRGKLSLNQIQNIAKQAIKKIKSAEVNLFEGLTVYAPAPAPAPGSPTKRPVMLKRDSYRDPFADLVSSADLTVDPSSDNLAKIEKHMLLMGFEYKHLLTTDLAEKLETVNDLRENCRLVNKAESVVQLEQFLINYLKYKDLLESNVVLKNNIYSNYCSI